MPAGPVNDTHAIGVSQACKKAYCYAAERKPVKQLEQDSREITMSELKKGSETELYVEKLVFGGKALAHVDGFVVFMEHAVPGQKVRARIVRRKRQYADAQVIEVISQSNEYTEPFCKHFGTCGGCQWQDIPYEAQLRWKREHVTDALVHLAGVGEVVVNPAVPSPEVRYYRNKMEFTFSNRRWLLPEEIASTETRYDKTCALGLHVRGFFDKIFNVETCFLESPGAVEILTEAREWCRRSSFLPYSIKEQDGFWRFVVIREGKRTNQTLVHLLTTARQGGAGEVDALSARLLERFPWITTIVHSVSDRKAQVAAGESSRIVHGPGYIEELLGHARYRVSAHSFFQTNPSAVEGLYETVRRMGEFTGKEVVWDLYCGTGSIAIFIAGHVKRVTGIELVEDAVRDADENCRLNGIENCRFRAGDLKGVIREMAGSGTASEPPDVVVTDPPRAGMHPEVVQALLETAPKRILYVSCNPATLARDLALLSERYAIREVQPFDLFPHTSHIECVVRLDRQR